MTISFKLTRGENFIGDLIYKSDRCSLWQGDCIEVMKDIPDKSIDTILCDLPYGTTNRNKWDEIIPFENLWTQYERLIKPNGAILLFSDEPFTSKLICSNMKMFKQRITWDKDRGFGFLNAHKMLMKQTEDICLFYNKTPTYNPQMVEANPDRIRPVTNGGENVSLNYGTVKHVKNDKEYDPQKRYPTNLIKMSSNTKECNPLNRLHPTQKPVELCEWLIKTYSNEGYLILDNCMGSGSSGVAALNTNRRFIGIELDTTYCGIAKDRIQHIVSDIS